MQSWGRGVEEMIHTGSGASVPSRVCEVSKRSPRPSQSPYSAHSQELLEWRGWDP